jgi:hypothetical protein
MATKTPLRLTGCEKGTRETSWRYDLLHGLKPNVAMIGFIGPAQAVPLLQSMSRTISSASEVSITRFSMRDGFGAGFGRPCGTRGFCRRRFPGGRENKSRSFDSPPPNWKTFGAPFAQDDTGGLGEDRGHDTYFQGWRVPHL